jgi:acyl-CoA thioesterase-1
MAMQSASRLVAFEFAGGDAFFWGLTLLAGAAVLLLRRDGPRVRVAIRLATLCAWIAIVPSATPLPLWFYGAGAVLSILALKSRSSRLNALARWVGRVTHFSSVSQDAGGQAASATPNPFDDQTEDRSSLWQLSFAPFLLICWCIAAAAWELSYRMSPSLEEGKPYQTLVVIGDSVSAGLNGRGEPTWPNQFRERYFGSVFDLSAPGATARLALRQAKVLNERLPKREAVVLIEIGGNDFFELIPPAEFERDLENLLDALERPNRQLVMLELPLPPFYNAYGRIQRKLAVQHGVPLISKREFGQVIFAKDATLDSVHLSPTGHRLFADMVWQHVGTLLHTPAIESMTLYSLTPDQTSAATNFNGYVVLGKVDVASEQERVAIFTALQQGIDLGYVHGAFGCFEPHHGVRLRRDGKTYDYVLCFQCLNVAEFVDGKYTTETTMVRTAQALIDQHLKSAHVLQAKD